MESNAQERLEVEWIRRAQQGDHEAFGLLVEQYQRRVFSMVFHLVHQQNEVEDLVQEIFIKTFRAIRSYNFRSIWSLGGSHIGKSLLRLSASQKILAAELLLAAFGRESQNAGKGSGTPAEGIAAKH